MHSSVIKKAFQASMPALFGYVSLGISFGFIFAKSLHWWYLAPLMSLLVYAGAAQFVAITMLVKHGSFIDIIGTTLIINLRHIFYGISFLGKFSENIFKKIYMIFGITDESYSILSTIRAHEVKNFDFLVILFAHLYWVLGTVIGAIMGNIISFDLSFLAFTLVALFIVLTIEQAIALKRSYPFIIAIFSSVIGLLYFKGQMLFGAIALSTVVLILLYQFEGKKI